MSTGASPSEIDRRLPTPAALHDWVADWGRVVVESMEAVGCVGGIHYGPEVAPAALDYVVHVESWRISQHDYLLTGHRAIMFDPATF